MAYVLDSGANKFFSRSIKDGAALRHTRADAETKPESVPEPTPPNDGVFQYLFCKSLISGLFIGLDALDRNRK